MLAPAYDYKALGRDQIFRLHIGFSGSFFGSGSSFCFHFLGPLECVCANFSKYCISLASNRQAQFGLVRFFCSSVFECECECHVYDCVYLFCVRVFVQKLNFLAHFGKHFTSHFILCDFIQCCILFYSSLLLLLLLRHRVFHSISLSLPGVYPPFIFVTLIVIMSHTVSISHFLSHSLLRYLLFSISYFLSFAIVLIFAWLCISRVSTLNHHKIKTMNVVGISSCSNVFVCVLHATLDKRNAYIYIHIGT